MGGKPPLARETKGRKRRIEQLIRRKEDDTQTGPRRRAGGTGGPWRHAGCIARGRGEGRAQEDTDEGWTPARALRRTAADAGGVWREPYLRRLALAHAGRKL